MKKILFHGIGMMLTIAAVSVLGGIFVSHTEARVPSYTRDFGGLLIDQDQSDESAIDLGVTNDASLVDNLKKIFYPTTDGDGGIIWRAIRVIAVGVLILFLVWAGARMVLYSDNPDELQKSKMNIIYIIYGAALLFLATWIFGTALDLGSVEGVTGGEDSLIDRGEENIIKVVLSFLKGAGFFVAIIFLARYGYQMMQSFDNEERLKNARRGILNVFMALVFIKVIDYLYFIAQQEDFKNRAVELVVDSSRFLGYIAGIIFVIALIYAGYMMVTANGNDEQITKAKRTIKTVFVSILIILLFLLVIYQIFQDVL